MEPDLELALELMVSVEFSLEASPGPSRVLAGLDHSRAELLSDLDW